MAEFKVGDRVRCVEANWGKLKVGDLGTIIPNPPGFDDPLVEWDNACGGHNGGGNGKDGHCWWVSESEIELVKEEPKEFKVGDRVKVVKTDMDSKEKWIDKVFTIKEINPNGVGCHKEIHYGVGGQLGCPFVWLHSELELVTDEVPSPEPTPVTNINITVNLYENACWYCRKGGLVDLYLAGAMGICPSCGRVCNDTRGKGFTSTKIGSGVIEFKPPKRENKPLTTEELKALPDGTRVFTVCIENGEEKLKDHYTCWRTKEGDLIKRKCGHYGINSNGRTYHTYLEMPEGAVDSGA